VGKKEIDKIGRETRKLLLKESTSRKQTLRDSTSKEEVLYVDYWSPHIMLLLLVSASTVSKAKTGLPD
jgi:hypothetical protein